MQRGMQSKVIAARRGLVAKSSATLPSSMTALRAATGKLAPIALRKSSVSAVNRETSSPVDRWSKNV